jgi:hypothetical protein
MSIPEKDELIINLKILSQLEKNRKLITKETYLNLESDNTVQIPEFFKRWFRGDSRDEALKKIDNIIVKAINLMDKYDDLEQYLTDSIIGLENLKDTYSKCTQTKARIDVIIEKINKVLHPNQNNDKLNNFDL